MYMRQAITNNEGLEPDLIIRCMATKWSRILSKKDKALLVKLLYMIKESMTVAQRKFRLQKIVKTGKEPSTVVRLIKIVQRDLRKLDHSRIV
ncbi:hypothetical protein TNCV_3541731 [Trichonephila clavipes]|nr:hypothetical protein TNCV_3541731 [Trichonephila clavipes]